MKSRKFLYSLTSIVLTSFLVSVFIVFAADPGTPFAPDDNVQDPGDPLSVWGGCGPTDPNCYVTVSGGVSTWDTITSPAGAQSLTFDDGELNSWTVNSNTETFHTITANSLTTGKVFSIASSTLSSGSLIDLAITGTAALTNQKGINVSLTGANASIGQITYAGYFSNTHTGSTPTNIGVYGGTDPTTNGSIGVYGVGGTGIYGDGSFGIGVHGETTSYIGIRATSTDGVAFESYTTSGASIESHATSGIPISLFDNTTGTNTVEPMMQIYRSTTGTAATGLGGSIVFNIETNVSPEQEANSIVSKWTTATDATRTSEFYITGVNSGTTGTLLTISGDGKTGIGDTTPASLLTVGSGDLFQVNSSGAIAAVTGYTQGSGTMSLTSANTTQVTTSSILALNGNSLTSGTGFYGASSTLTSGALVNLSVSSTAALLNTQKVLNISTSGANANANQTTYGGYFSNTHTGAGGLTANRAVYATSSGATTNTAVYATASGGTTAIGLYATASGGTNNYAINSDGPLLLGGTTSNNILIQYITGDNLSIGAGATQSGSFRSLFFGSSSGLNATNADDSLFLGLSSGDTATNASNSNFLGRFAGYQATNASNSNFLGESAGYQATNASHSIFMGYQAGYTSANAKNSIFIGNNAGVSDAVDNTVDGYSILIGPITSTNGFSNSIAIGYGASNTSANELVIGSGDSPINNVYFGGGTSNTGFAGSDYTINGSTPGAGLISENLAGGSLILAGGKATGNAVGGSLIFKTSDAGASGATLQSLSTKATLLTNGNFGIGDTTPDYLLDVEKTGTDGYIFAIHDSDGECLHDPEAGSETVTCSSDERLKSNIVDSESVLDYLNSFRIRNYDVIASGNNMTGVIAQEVLENHPELVSILSNGMYSVQLPNQWKLVKGIQELDIKLRDINDFENEGNSFGEKLIAWFASSTNGIKKLFVKDTICIGDYDTCISKADLEILKVLIKEKALNNVVKDTPIPEGGSSDSVDEDTAVEEDPGDVTIEESAPEEIMPAEENINESEEIINQEQENTNEENHQDDQSSN